MSIHYAKVILFKASGKFYTEEEWRIPTEVPDHSPERGDFVRGVLGPWDMALSPDFRRISGGAVLVTDEKWGYPHLFPSESEPVENKSTLEARVKTLEKRLQGIIETHHLWDGS